MPLFQAPDGQQTHHHSLLAGVSAGAMAVLVAFGLELLAWHRVAGAVGDAVIVIVCAVTAAVVLAVLLGTGWAVLWLRHRLRHPEVLSRQPVRAEVVSEAPAAIPAPSPVAELPPAQYITHNHFHGAEAVEAAVQAMQERQEGR